jgi:2-desacetyl-2-hydroxyethyl bacteriochlorophyllide A dehydrogenase
MKAAVLRGKRDIVIMDRPEPEVEPGGIVIRVRACGICGSDLHLYRHGVGGEMIMGHELSGDITAVGARVTGVREGDRVTAITGRGCGECYWCRQGQWLRCSRMQLLGYGGIPGAFAEYVSIPNFSLNLYAMKLPPSMPYEVGATAEPLSVALYSVTRAQVKPEDAVVVIGAGVIGLCIVKVLKAFGVKTVIISGRRAGRLTIAEESGADVVVDAARDDIVPVASEATSGRGADVVFECAGTAVSFEQSLRLAHRGSRVVLVGLYEEPISWDPTFIVSNDIDFIGAGLRFDLPGAIGLMESGRVDTRQLITHRFPLDDAREAFETQLAAEDAIKVIIKP